jgi:hypothetical protein
MVTIRAERTDVARGVMDEPVSFHLILAFKALPTLTPGATRNRAVVRAS